MTILWPSFVMAGVLEGARLLAGRSGGVALVRPDPVDASPQAVYTLSFLDVLGGAVDDGRHHGAAADRSGRPGGADRALMILRKGPGSGSRTMVRAMNQTPTPAPRSRRRCPRKTCCGASTRRGPRYTSYPTADRFVEAFGAAESLPRCAARDARRRRPRRCRSTCTSRSASRSATTARATRSSRSTTSAPANTWTRLRPRSSWSSASLGAARAVVAAALRRRLADVPVATHELDALMARAARAFASRRDAEVSIEVDPRTVDAGAARASARARLQPHQLRRAGLRPRGAEGRAPRSSRSRACATLMRRARALGFESINVDLIYGLPQQTPQSFARTVAQVGELRPTASRSTPTRTCRSASSRSAASTSRELPDAAQRVEMLGRRDRRLPRRAATTTSAWITSRCPTTRWPSRKRAGPAAPQLPGLQHAAGLRPDRPRRVGHRPRRRHATTRTRRRCPSTTTALRQRPAARRARHRARRATTCVRRDVIMALMCHGRVDFDAIERAHGVRHARGYFAAELERLRPMADAGLVELEPDAIQVTAAGWYVVRAIALVFDRYLRDGRVARALLAHRLMSAAARRSPASRSGLPRRRTAR